MYEPYSDETASDWQADHSESMEDRRYERESESSDKPTEGKKP